MMDTKILFATNKLEEYGNIISYLEKNGFSNIVTAADGDTALKYLGNSYFDFAIFDVNLPILDGLQLCKIMRSFILKQCERIPVVLLSEAYKSSMISQLAKSAGAYAVLHTPFEMEELLFLVYNKLQPEKISQNSIKTQSYKAKVMIADNNHDIVKNLGAHLSAEGYKTLIAYDEEEAFRILRFERPHIVFLNSDVSKFNGQDVLKLTKEIIPETIVIMITIPGCESSVIEFLKSGANDYITDSPAREIVSSICEDALMRYNQNLIGKHLNEIELTLHSMVDGMIDGVVLTDAKGRITLINKAGQEMLKYLNIRADNNSITNINNMDIKEIYDEIFIKKQRYISFEINTKGDAEKYFIVITSPMSRFAGENTGFVIVIRDVTREYLLQYQVIKSERIYAVSNLVAGAAHELNNPLAGIQLCTELVSNEPSISEKARKYLARIQKETEQIQGVVKSLLTFTGNYTLTKEQVNINEIIEEIINQKAYQFEHASIKLIKLLDEGLSNVFVDKHQMRRVFLNIIENACASMAESKNGKCLTIKTEVYKETIKIFISDTGPGIPKEYLSKIFEPFFTTKDYKKSKGTGLGLSIAHSIIHQHNGNIYAKSELGAGATFVIELPIK